MAINRAKVSRAAEKFVRQGRLEDAIREYKRLLNDNSQDVTTLNKVGDLHRQAGQVARAVGCYRRIAEHYRDRGFATKAIAMFKKVAKLAPEDAQVREDLAALYSDAGLTRDALNNLREAAGILTEAGEVERALELESRVLELCPDDWSGLRSQGGRLMAAGEEERAVAIFLRAAEGLVRSGKLEEAVECCREAASGAPRNPEPMATMIRLMLRHERGEEAVAELRQRLAEDDLPHLHALLGEALVAREEPQAAREALQAAADSAFAAGDLGYQESLLRLDLLEGRLDQVAEHLDHLVGLMREEGEESRALTLLCNVLERDAGVERAHGLLLDICRQNKVSGAELDAALDMLSGCLQAGQHKADLADILSGLGRQQPETKDAAPVPAAIEEEIRPEAAVATPVATGHVVLVEGEDGSEVEPDFVNEHLVEADVFVKYGLHAKAAAHLGRIVQRYPRTLVAHQRLAELYCEIGQAEACAIHSVQLAEVHRLRGEMAEARQVLLRAAGLQPENPSLVAMLNGLAPDQPLPPYEPTFAGRSSASPQAPPVEVAPAVAPPAAPPVADEQAEPSPAVAPEAPAPANTPPPASTPPPAKVAAPPPVIEEETLELELDQAEAADEEQALAPPAARESAPEIQAAPPPAEATPPPAEAAPPQVEPAPPQVEPAPPQAEPAPPQAETEPPPVSVEAAGDPAAASEAKDDEPVSEADDAVMEDDYFDLAQAIERELAGEEQESAAIPIVDDQEKEQDPITGIREAIDRQVGQEDHQTHYQLGIAFKEMEMLDEAIGEFQQAAQDPDSFLMCCSMLGLCFRAKGMPQIAEKWYRKGLDRGDAVAAGEEQILGLLYDLGTLHQERGAADEARNCFTEVYASNANYRDVAARLRSLSQDADGAPSPSGQ